MHGWLAGRLVISLVLNLVKKGEDKSMSSKGFKIKEGSSKSISSKDEYFYEDELSSYEDFFYKVERSGHCSIM